jgi:hypothetical protein
MNAMMKQPLSYQTLSCSCWVTSVINGLLFLYGDKNKIPGLALRLLHSVLTDEGVDSGGNSKADWEIVLGAVADKCKLKVRSVKADEVENAMSRVDFKKSVVLCDICAGTHSILINGEKDNWYYGFDPDWDRMKSGHIFRHEEFEKFPDVNNPLQGSVNVRIFKDHLFGSRATKKRLFSMGAVSDRNITIISHK